MFPAAGRLHSIALLLMVGALSLGCQEKQAGDAKAAASKPAGAASSPASTAAPPPAGQALPTSALPTPATGAEATPVPAELPAVVARVNGEAIERRELETAVQTLEQRAGRPVPPAQRSKVLRDALDQIVSYKLLAQESRARKMAVSDAEIAARLETVQKQFENAEAFRAALATRQMSLAEFRQDMRDEMLISKMLEQEVGKTISITDKDVQDFHAKNPERFKQPETVRASHILVRVDPAADPATIKTVTVQMGDLLKKARSGADFAALAREHSQDSSAQQGGDLGFFAAEQMVPEFSKSAFALQKGQISDVVRTPFGLHIIKAVDRRPARTIPLEEVRAEVVEFLTAGAREQRTESFVQKLKAKSKIDILI